MIELKNFSYTYPRTAQTALDHISLPVEKGRCVLVTGPSGAGKTTLCLAAAGILFHEYGGKKEGLVTVDGRDVSSFATLSEVAKTIGIVFDDAEAQLIFTTVKEEILSALEYRGLEEKVIDERFDSIVATTYLTELLNRSPHHLSGGQKQRVALAATLSLGNEVLILDEPTAELDEHATRRIVDILAALKAQGKTILLIEHKYEHFRDIADTLIVLEQGSVSAMGPPDEVLCDERIRKVVIPDFSGIRDTKMEGGIKNDAPEVVGVRRLSYTYGETLALNDVSLAIRAGEFVAIVGENGSGKTTLVKHFNRLLSPSSGDVIIRGKNTKSSTITDLARDVGLVFQNPDHMFFADTVKEEIGFGLKNLNIPDGNKIIDAALQEVGLLHTKDLYPRWLSRGERQRLAIACVIAMAPSIIVLDEPTTGLDGNEARLVMEILKGLQNEGHTIIVITHNKEIAQNCADRIITMEKGSIISDIFVREALLG
jgi:energy-coupling factor transporter ATP-binding protein EcfA2